jgi:hypothetical protein
MSSLIWQLIMVDNCLYMNMYDYVIMKYIRYDYI